LNSAQAGLNLWAMLSLIAAYAVKKHLPFCAIPKSS
jgi:hypothetical protein